MAKKRNVVEPNIVINSWFEAQELGAQLVGIVEQIKSEEAEYNIEEQKRREELTSRLAPFRIQSEEIQIALERWCQINKNDFGDKRSRDLHHIIVSFRTHPPAVKQLKGVKQEVTLLLIEQSKWADSFIVTTKSISKEAILLAYQADGGDGTISAAELKQFGLEIVKGESFSWEAKLAVEQS